MDPVKQNELGWAEEWHAVDDSNKIVKSICFYLDIPVKAWIPTLGSTSWWSEVQTVGTISKEKFDAMYTLYQPTSDRPYSS